MNLPGPEYDRWAGSPKLWPWPAARAAVKFFNRAVERDTGGRLTGLHDVGGGQEGRVIGAHHEHLGPVVLKIGDADRGWYKALQSDYLVSAQIVGAEIQGVARIFGVWKHDPSNLHAILRERVDTNWSTFIDDAGVRAVDWADAERELWMLGSAISRACRTGLGPRPVVAKSPRRMKRIIAGGLGPVVVGILALYEHGVCVGADLHGSNLGWRYDADGRPEAVILDLGSARSREDAWTHAPRAANATPAVEW